MSDYFFSTFKPDLNTVNSLFEKKITNSPFQKINMFFYSNNKNIFTTSKIFVIYDGVIYNELGKTVSTNTEQYIMDCYLEYGTIFTRFIDGEFSIILVDYEKNICVFSTDIFGTKPLYYSIEDNKFVLCTYLSVLGKMSNNSIRANPNTIYVYNLQTNVLTTDKIYEFSIAQYKKDFDDWNMAFEKSILKRLNGLESIIPLSSGYDSGAICCEANKQHMKFKAVSFTGKENMEVLEERIKLIKNNYILNYSKNDYYSILKKFLKEAEHYRDDDYELIRDESSIGIGLICEYAKKQNVNYIISGSGADSIYSYTNIDDFCIEESINKWNNIFPENLENFFPWQNFFNGNMQRYLFQEEYISRLYGIQIRYPFLDKCLVQEFLWLDSSLKNQFYKSPIQNYLIQNNYPYDCTKKIGFYI